MGGKRKFSDELAAIIETLRDGSSGGMEADAIAASVSLPACQVVDLIANYLSDVIEKCIIRPMGRKTTVYRLKEIGAS